MTENFKQIKVLQLIQKPQLRGAEIFACQLSKELTMRGMTVDVVYLFEHTPFALEFDLKFIPLEANKKKRLWDLKAYRKLNKIIKEGRYDIVQANAADTLKYAVTSKLLFGWKSRIVFRNASLMGRLMHSPLQKLYNRWLVSRCDRIASVSENCRQDLIRFFPKAEQMSVTIPSGTYVVDETIGAHPRPERGPVFLNVGGFVWEKNHEFLIKVFQRYLQKYGDANLWLVGDGKLKNSIEEEVRQMQISSHVTFWGSRKDVASFLNGADLFVMPSVVEGMPGAILEALSSGLPVLASNVGGIPEILQHDVNGYCMASWNEDEYVSSMHTLATDPLVRSRLIAAGKQTIRNSFDMRLIADRFITFYQDIVARDRKNE